MDNRKLQVAAKFGQVWIVQDDEVVARLHHSDRRDNVEATEYAEELVRRWNAFPELVDFLQMIVNGGINEAGEAQIEIEASQLLKSLDHA